MVKALIDSPIPLAISDHSAFRRPVTVWWLHLGGLVNVFGGWTHRRCHPLMGMADMSLQPSSIHPTPIAYLSHKTTQWRYGRSRWPAQIWSSRQSLWPLQGSAVFVYHTMATGFWWEVRMDAEHGGLWEQSACHSRCYRYTRNHWILPLWKAGGYKITATWLHWIAEYNYLGGCRAQGC